MTNNNIIQYGVLGLTVALTVAGCSKLFESAENEARQRAQEAVEDQREAGTGDDPADDTPTEIEATIHINSVQPNRGLTDGQELVDIIGWGFQPDASEPAIELVVMFGPDGARCTDLQITSDTSLQCVTPAYPTAERVTVRVVKFPEGGTPEAALLESGFEYYDPVTIANIEPTRGPTRGGTTVVIYGTGFVEGTTVRFGTGGPIPATLVDSQTITVSTPAMPRNTYAVTVTNMNGEFTLPGAFTTYEPVRITGVQPVAGPIGGGTSLAVQGTGFISPTDLNLGEVAHTATNNPEETELSSTTLPAVPAQEGPVDISTTNTNGDDVLRNGFVFYDPANTETRIIAIVPPAGPIEGGTTVNVIVGGFAEPQTSVMFGDTLADCTAADTFTIACVVPPATGEGLVDITVGTGDQEVTATEAFSYIDLRLEGISPNEGAIAGGTYVTLQGNGFGRDTEVFFGENQVTALTIVDPTQITLWTPSAGSEGLVDVRVETLGMQETAADFFTYFDPSDMNEWNSGGSIDGEINITVINGGNNQRVANAFVMVGASADPTMPYLYGYTDQRGQITLSGPGLVGAQSVHAGKSEFGNWSWIDTDARNLTMMLTPANPPQPDPLPPCPEPEMSAPPLIRGVVTRIKDEFNTGNDYVIVTTTYRSFAEDLPDPGSKAQLISNGPFELFARTGDLIVLALAGTVTPENTLKVHAMGFKPFMYTEASSGQMCVTNDDCPEAEQCTAIEGSGDYCLRVYDDVDIVIDTALDQPMTIELDNPPLGSPTDFGLATHSLATVWYDFGYMGLHMMSQKIEEGASALTVDMPKRLPSALAHAPFNVDTAVGYFYDGQLYPPTSEVRTHGLTDTTQDVVVTPFLRTHQKLAPGMVSTVSDPIHFEYLLRPDSTPEVLPTGNVNWLYDFEVFVPCEGAMPMSRPIIYWMAMSPGDTVNFDLPVFPQMGETANLGSGTYYWQIMGLYSPPLTYEGVNLNSLFQWKSRALYASSFTLDRQTP